MQTLPEGIKVETFPNIEFRDFHIRQQLIQKGKWYSTEYYTVSEVKIELSASSEAIVQALIDVQGILKVTVHPYKIGINKSKMYSWEELYPQIILILSKYLPTSYNCFK